MDLFDIVAARASGLGSGASQKQADWNQNDSSKKDYIENRTHWKEEFERDYTVLPNIEPDPTIGLIEYGQKIGLEIGKEYTLEAHLLDGTIETIQAIATEMPEEDIGIAGIPCIVVENTCNIIDGVVFDITTEPPITVGDNCYYFFDSSVAEVLEKGVIKNLPSVETVIHKIPNEFIEFPEFPELPKIPETDQEYYPKSSNAQSGKAVKQAIEEYDESLIVDNSNFTNNSLRGEKLLDFSVPAQKLSDGSITGQQLGSNLPYNKLETPTKITQIDVPERVAYVSAKTPNTQIVSQKFEKMMVTGTIVPELKGKQYLSIYLDDYPSSQYCIYQFPIDTTNYDSFEVHIEVEQCNLPTGQGRATERFVKVEGCAFIRGKYTNDTIILSEKVVPFIPLKESASGWCFCLKEEAQGEMGYFLPGTSISIHCDKTERVR